MTDLQNEIIKLLEESNSKKEELKEVKFNDITNQFSKLNTGVGDVSKIINGPIKALTDQAKAAENSLKMALSAYHEVEDYVRERNGDNSSNKVNSYTINNTSNTPFRKDDIQTPKTNDKSNSKSKFLNPDYWTNKFGSNAETKDDSSDEKNSYQQNGNLGYNNITINGKQQGKDGYSPTIDLPKREPMTNWSFSVPTDNLKFGNTYSPFNSNNQPASEPTVQQSMATQDTPAEKTPKSAVKDKATTIPAKKKITTRKPTIKKAAESIEESNFELQNEGIRDTISNWKINKQEKKVIIDQLQNASRMLSQAQTQIGSARANYVKVYKQLEELYKQIEQAQKMVDKKKSWFGRLRGFWD